MDTSNRLRHSVRERLEYVEFLLFWEGALNRRDLIRRFGISAQQASADISRYVEEAPNNMRYEQSSKAYVPTEEFIPRVSTPSARRYLSELRLVADGILPSTEAWVKVPPPYATVPLISRATSPRVLRPIVRAIRCGESVRLMYYSFSKPDGSVRNIDPHALAFDGRRWHVRAWCHNRLQFRDFVFARMEAPQPAGSASSDSGEDIAWHTELELNLVPHPSLSPAKQRLIEREYGMDRGTLKIQTRAALAFYVIEYLRLDESPIDAVSDRYHLYLQNFDEVRRVMNRFDHRTISRE